MGKGNSGLLSKHQVKLPYTEDGVIGDVNGYEVLTEVVIRFRSKNATATNSVRLCGRTANDDKWYEIGTLQGEDTGIFHVASWDYIRYDCIIFGTTGSENTIIASAFFSDGMFTVNAIETMDKNIQDRLEEIDSNICDLKQEINIINRQIEIITDHEEDEVK